MNKKQTKSNNEIKISNKMSKIEQTDKIYLLIHGVLLIHSKNHKV